MNTDPGEYALDGYLALLRDRPDWFINHPAGGIEILTNPGEIALARAAVLSHRAAAGLDVSDTRAGLLAKDPYMTVVRDAVVFRMVRLDFTIEVSRRLRSPFYHYSMICRSSYGCSAMACATGRSSFRVAELSRRNTRGGGPARGDRGNRRDKS